MRVCCYYNLNAGGWTVATVTGKRGKGLKIRGADSLVLRNCTFVVQPAAQRKVYNGANKSVHAWVIGELVESIPAELTPVPITYNPRRSARELFRRRDNGAVIAHAEYVLFGTDGHCIAYGVS